MITTRNLHPRRTHNRNAQLRRHVLHLLCKDNRTTRLRDLHRILQTTYLPPSIWLQRQGQESVWRFLHKAYPEAPRRPPGGITADPDVAFLNRHKSAVGIYVPFAAPVSQPPVIPILMTVLADVFRNTLYILFIVTKTRCDFSVIFKMGKYFTNRQFVPIIFFLKILL